MFAGLISREHPVSAWGDPESILAALAPFRLESPRDCWVSDGRMLLQVDTRNGATSANIFRHAENGVAVAFWGRLDNRVDLRQQLEAENDASDDELVALAWLKWGEHCPERMIGDFALAITDPGGGTLFLACDVIGVKPLFYRIDEHGIFFANTAAAFKPLEIGTLTRSQKWMAAYLLDLSHSHTDTAYEEIKKLPCAHSLLMHADGTSSLRRYHRFVDDAPVEKTRNPAWLQAYKSVWQEAVACRMPMNEKIGTENSGGLDSGSITAEIARQLGPDIECLHGMGFCRQELEPQFIMATAMKYKMKHNYLVSNGSECQWSETRRREHLIHGYPQEHPDGSFHVPFYEICQQQGIRVLFSGFGGDEAVTYLGGMTARYEMLDQGNFHGLWRILPGAFPMRALRVIKTAMNFADSTCAYDVLMQRWEYQFLRSDVISEYDLEKKYIAACTYDQGFRSVNKAVVSLVSQSYPQSRLQACTLVAANYGVEYVWPLWDQRLIQQWLSTPTIWKVGEGGTDRYLHRMAVADASAGIVAWNPTKDMGYAALTEAAETASNAPLLNRLLELAGSLPEELLLIVDAVKIQSMAERGLREDWKNSNIRFALEDYLYRLENLVAWLDHEQ